MMFVKLFLALSNDKFKEPSSIVSSLNAELNCLEYSLFSLWNAETSRFSLTILYVMDSKLVKIPYNSLIF